MKFKYTRFQVAMEIVGLLLLVGMIIFVCIQWNQLPNKIPGHYNAMGEVDRWGSKSEIFLLPIVSTILYSLFTVLSFLPKTWGLPVKITESNREKLYNCTRSMLLFVKVEILGIFFYLTYNMATANSLPGSFAPIVLLILIGTSVCFVRSMYQIGKKTR